MGEFTRVYKSDMTDRQLMGFWRMMQEAGRDRAVSYSLPPLDATGFVRWMRQDGVYPWFVLFRERPCGFFFLTEYEGKAARIHFGTLPMGTKRTASKQPVVVAFGMFGLASLLWEQLVTGSYRLDTLIGLTPVCNKEAIKLIHKVGAVDCGIIPAACYYHDTGENVAGLATVYTRETVPSWARVM